MEKNVQEAQAEQPEARVGELGQAQELRRRLMLTVCYALVRKFSPSNLYSAELPLACLCSCSR